MTQENGNGNNKLAVIRNYMRKDEIMARFAEVLGNYGASAYVSSVMLAVGNSRDLQECSMTSIATSAMRAATLRLSCDPAIGQAYLVPFKGSATLVVGYKGLRDMAIRTGKYRHLNVAKIYEGEEVIEDRITGVHRIEGSKKSSKIVGWLWYMELFTGFAKSIYMSVEEIHAHAAKYSKSYQRSDSPWKTHTEMMEKKTLMRLGISRWGYLDPYDLMTMNAADEAEEGKTIDGEFKQTDSGGLLSGFDFAERDTDEGEAPTPEAPATRTPDQLRAALLEDAKTAGAPDDKVFQETNGCLKYILNNDGARMEFLNWLNGAPVKSSKDMQPGLIVALHHYLIPAYDKNGGTYYPQNEHAQAEITAAHAHALEASGQKSLL